tara:strand:- start:1498 stop:1842 length:345 start_codon:yes stop_codon:yes gene_type:complete
MHGSAPKLLIIAKREVLGDEMPDFSGDSYIDAKKKMMGSDDPPDTKYSEDHHEALKQMAEEMYQASEHHSGLADKLMEICKDLYDESDDKDGSKDDKPHKSYGDHNPYGSHKGY